MQKVKQLLKSTLVKDSSVVVSCSGGPDSMCLMDLLVKIRNELNLKIICAHVNHGVRSESIEEESFVKNYCKKNNIIFELLTIEKYQGNFHNDARVRRYKFLNDICKKYDSSIFLTAHHGDDLVETILMRISRGSNLPGYAGFKVINKLSTFDTFRPLISVTKKDILKYNTENDVEYRVDKTNESLEYTRNKYRHIALPALKEIDLDFHKKFLKFSEKLYEYDEFIKDYIVKNEIIVNNTINVVLYLKESEFIQRKSIELFISYLQQKDEFYVTDNIIFEIDKLLKSEKGKAKINLPNGYFGIKENKKFFIEK